MTFLTQEGYPRLEQVFHDSAVGVMADSAVFSHWLMVMHKRSALLHVTGIAGVVIVWLQQLLRIVAMNIVARRAAHLALRHRVVRWAAHLRALFLVAGVAGFGLLCPIAHRIFAFVNLVATAALYIARRVRARLPPNSIAALVARQAGVVTRFRCSRRLPAEGDIRLAAATEVLFARAVTTGACRGAAVGAGAVLGLADRQQFRATRFIVATGALGVSGED